MHTRRGTPVQSQRQNLAKRKKQSLLSSTERNNQLLNCVEQTFNNYDGASVKAEKKFSDVFPKTAEKNYIIFFPPFFQKQQKKNY